MDEIAGHLAFDPSRLTDWDILLRLVVQILLLCLSAFFSSSETAFFSISPAALQRLRRERNPKEKVIRRLLDQPRRLIISILCGNELINIAASINLATILLALYGDRRRAAILNVAVMVPLLLLFGEITPKTVALTNPVKVATRITATPMTAWVKISTPLYWIVRQVAERVTNLLVGQAPTEKNILGVDEFRSLLSTVEKEGVMSPSERTLIENLIRGSEIEIREIMTPRPRIKFVDADQPIERIVEDFRKSRYERVPVYRGHRDTILGFLHAEDMVRLVQDRHDLSSTTIDALLRPPVIVPPTKKLDEMLEFFKTRGVRAAAVVSEFGGVDGFISMTDIIAFLLAGISGRELRPDAFQIIEPHVYEVSGLLKIEDFNDLTNARLSDPHMTTVGGYVFRYLDRLPEQGERVDIEGLAFTVLQMQGNLIRRLRVGPAAGRDRLDREEIAPAAEVAPKAAEAKAGDLPGTREDAA